MKIRWICLCPIRLSLPCLYQFIWELGCFRAGSWATTAGRTPTSASAWTRSTSCRCSWRNSRLEVEESKTISKLFFSELLKSESAQPRKFDWNFSTLQNQKFNLGKKNSMIRLLLKFYISSSSLKIFCHESQELNSYVSCIEVEWPNFYFASAKRIILTTRDNRKMQNTSYKRSLLQELVMKRRRETKKPFGESWIVLEFPLGWKTF